MRASLPIGTVTAAALVAGAAAIPLRAEPPSFEPASTVEETRRQHLALPDPSEEDLVEEVTRMPFQDALSSEIWSRMGAEADASIYAGRHGIPLTSGGLLAKPRDMARFGLLFTPSSKVVSDERIISDRIVRILTDGGRPELLRNARFGGGRVPAHVKHNVYQWDRVFTNNDLYKGGWAGQGLLVNPDRDLVAVWVGYSKDDANSEMAPLQPLRRVLEGVFGD